MSIMRSIQNPVNLCNLLNCRDEVRCSEFQKRNYQLASGLIYTWQALHWDQLPVFQEASPSTLVLQPKGLDQHKIPLEGHKPHPLHLDAVKTATFFSVSS